MRGGSYGWQAADAGVIGICWTNTLANVPPWGAGEPRDRQQPADHRDSASAGARRPRHGDVAVLGGRDRLVSNARRASAGGRRIRRRRSAHRIPPRSKRRGDCCRSASGKAPACRSCSTWRLRCCLAAARRFRSPSEPERETGLSQVFIAIGVPTDPADERASDRSDPRSHSASVAD